MERNMNFDLTDDFEPSCLQGNIETSYSVLVNCFGEPNSDGDGYKVQKEWMIKFYDGTYATIYDWKEGDSYNGEGQGTHYTDVTDWHIGGMSQKSVSSVHAAMEAYLRSTCYNEPKQLT